MNIELYLWIIFALGAAIIYGVSRLFYRRATRFSEPYAFALLLNCTGALFALPFALYAWQLPTQWYAWLLVVISAILWAAGMWFMGASMKHTPVSAREPIAQTELIWVFFFSAIFLREILTVTKILGALFIFAGMLLVTIHGKFIRASFSNHGVRLTLLAAVFSAAASIVDKKAIHYFTPGVYNFLLYVAPGLILLLFLKKRKTAVKQLALRHPKLLLLCGLCSATLYFCVLKAYEYADATLVYPLVKLGSLLAIGLGMLYFKEERVHITRKLLAGLLIILGAVLVAGGSFW